MEFIKRGFKRLGNHHAQYNKKGLIRRAASWILCCDIYFDEEDGQTIRSFDFVIAGYDFEIVLW